MTGGVGSGWRLNMTAAGVAYLSLFTVVLTGATVTVNFDPAVPPLAQQRLHYHFEYVECYYPVTVNIGGYSCQLNNSEAFQIVAKVTDKEVEINTCSNSPRGLSYSAYHVLEKIFGFAFLHPLQTTTRPVDVRTQAKNFTTPVTETPEREFRAFHLHTQHPLENAELLNGFSTYPDTVGWEAQLGEWISYMEWMIAQKLNRVQWFLLYSNLFQEYADSVERQQYLTQLVDIGHQFGLKVGISVGIELKQEHAYALVRTSSNPIQQIHEHVQYLSACGFDYMAVQLGSTEVTHGSALEMLDWLNEVTTFANELGMDVLGEMHISQGQNLKDWTNPETGEKGFNYNFLPYYAVPQLGAMAHTVQFFAFTDPAYTYGNVNFTQMFDFMMFTAKSGRQTIFYPEAAYDCSFDITVPLFLPLYVNRHLYDMQLIHDREVVEGVHIDGQLLFTSGFEIGYWVNNVGISRLAWNSRATDPNALSNVFSDMFQVFDNPMVSDFITRFSEAQDLWLIHGGNYSNTDLYLRAGIPYIEGWVDLFELTALIDRYLHMPILIQPDRISPMEVRFGLEGLRGMNYEKDLVPLLEGMSAAFQALAAEFATYTSSSQPELLQELQDSVQIFANRASFSKCLYAFSYAKHQHASDEEAIFNDCVVILNSTQVIMDRRVANFRVPPERIAFWRPNPTVYPPYQWAPRRLEWWWQDLMRIRLDKLSPCFLNWADPVAISAGEGTMWKFFQTLHAILDYIPGTEFFNECLAAPAEEPQIPYPF